MKTESKIFLFLIIFFAVVTPSYAYVTWQMGHFEVIGTTVFALTLLFCLMIWGLLVITGRTVGMRPEDRKDGEIVENAGALGFFPPSSIVPFWSALAITVILLGVVALTLAVTVWHYLNERRKAKKESAAGIPAVEPEI